MSSLRKAIDLKCRDCVYDPLEPGRWREQVENCGCADCPLYKVRPVPLAKSAQKGPFQRVSGDAATKPLAKGCTPSYTANLAGFLVLSGIPGHGGAV